MTPTRTPLTSALAIPLFLLAAWPSPGPRAQAPPQPPPEERPDGRHGAGRRDTARFLLVERMREDLQLTDNQSLKVLELMRAMDQERRVHQEAMEAIFQKIQTLLVSETVTDAQLRESLTQFAREQARFEARHRDLEQKLLDTLSPRQQAGFLILKRKLVGHQGPGAGPAPGRGQGRGRSSP